MTNAVIIPPDIWEIDEHLWRDWITSTNTSATTKQQYKRIITEFYFSMEKPIQQCTESDIRFYQRAERLWLEDSTVERRAAIIRAYWTFAREQACAEVSHEK